MIYCLVFDNQNDSDLLESKQTLTILAYYCITKK